MQDVMQGLFGEGMLKPPRLEPARVRADFPILARQVYGKPLVYLDSAASAQKPKAVLEALRRCYETEYANIHRGVHYLSMRATEAYEGAREKVRELLNAESASEIVFTRNATAAINLVAASFGRRFLREGDEILLSHMEHHSNIVPWQLLREDKGVVLKVAPISDKGELILDEFEKRLGPRTKLVAITHVSNALGTVVPVAYVAQLAKQRGIRILIDGSQAAPHLPVDVRHIDCDFYVFTGHKLYGPSGVGVLYGKAELLDAMPPWEGGGEMIRSVSFEKTEYNAIPYKFEAGTPPIAQAIGLGAAIDYVKALGFAAIAAHEQELLAYATQKLSALDRVRLIGTAADKAGIVSFVIEGVHAHDVGSVLDQQGIAVRTGHHCAQPVMARFNVPATARASFGVYTTADEIDALVKGVRKVQEIFRP
jgi:cysteine desulfurase/selenocysteine lyase